PALLHHRTGKTAGIAERVEVARLLMHPAAIEARAAGHLGHLVAVEHPGPRADGVVALRLLGQRRDLVRAQRTHDIAVLHPFAADLVVADHLPGPVVRPGLPADQPLGP